MIPSGKKRKVRVRTLRDERLASGLYSCAACGEHLLLGDREATERKDCWRTIVCGRCVYQNVRFTVRCARGHEHRFTTDSLWEARTAQEIGRLTHCRCGARGVAVTSERIGNDTRRLTRSAPLR